MDAKQNAPQITLEQISVEPIQGPGYWNIVWKVKNLAARPIKLLAARLPHGQFKSDQLQFEPAVDLPAQQEANFQVPVRCDEPAGLVTENAFVIFQVDWRGAPWRIFVRVRVVVNEKGEPNVTTELITTQKAGFTGVSSWPAVAMQTGAKKIVADKEKDLYILTRMRGWHRNWGVGFEETTGMVSNSLRMDQQKLLKELERIRKAYADDVDYKKLRKELPKDWPL